MYGRSNEMKQVSVGGKEDMHSSNRHDPCETGSEDYHCDTSSRSDPHVNGVSGMSHKPIKHLISGDHGGHDVMEHSPNHGRHHHKGIRGYHSGSGLPGVPFGGGISSEEPGESASEEAGESLAMEAGEESSEGSSGMSA